MADRFELYRLSLLPRSQGDLLSPGPEAISREQWLRTVFGEEQPFDHYGSEFHYVPAQDNASNSPVIGRVGRKLLREENKPPSEGLEDVMHEAWRAAVLVLDPTHHADGQKLAIQSVQDVGKPSALVKSLVAAINERHPAAPYAIEASQIIEEQSFWQFVKENEGNVTFLSMDFIAPNMFGSDDEFTNEMRAFRDSEAANNVRIALKNKEGMKLDTPRIRRAVNYASKGGGKIKAKAKSKKTYNSANSAKRTYLEDVKETGVALVKAARELANRILGR